MELLSLDELPNGFIYPPEFLRIINQSLTNLDPWAIYVGEDLKTRYEGLKGRYPERVLIPFARRWDNDDIACWDVGSPQKVFIIHDFASPGYEQKEICKDFWQWFKLAVNDMIEYEP